MADQTKTIGFIGAGKMAEAILCGLIKSGFCNAEHIICSDPAEGRMDEMKAKYGVRIAADNADVVRQSDLVVLAFKPQGFPAAVDGLGELVTQDKIIISIMAGVTIGSISAVLPGKVVRVMPNTPCMVGEMAAGFAAADDVTDDELAYVREMLSCSGQAVQVQEKDINAVTGVSGSGPAFVAYLIQKFINAGVAEGLDSTVARDLVLATFSGTANLLKEWDMEPDALIKMVSSPNGTTVAGRDVLESSDVGDVIISTVGRAAERGRELAEGK